MNILITGAAGFIGSHTAVELLSAGHYTVLLDNFSNSSPAVLERITKISGRHAPFYQGDIRDRALLRRVFAEQQIDSVIHFAALKAVGESVQNRSSITTTTSAAAWFCLKKWPPPACFR